MSCTTIYAIFPDKKGFVDFRDFSNSWGGAAFVWDNLKRRYESDLPEGDPSDLFGWSRVWEYDEAGGKMEPWERNVLRSTYDRAVLRRYDFRLMAHDMEVFKRAYYEAGKACSLGEQAECLRELFDKGALYVAWNQTSVVGFLLGGDYNEDTDDEIPYDIDKGEEHHFVEMAT